MLYSELSRLYEKLESTSKRLEKTEILSEFLKKLKKEKNKEIIYLLRGRIFPDFDERETGISEQLAIKALSKTAGISSENIVKEWRKIGDLGKVAEKLIKEKKQRTFSEKKLTVEKVLENLRKLPELVGKGTVAKKISLIAELLTSASPIETKYIIRTLLSDLRVGLGEGVLRDAIVWACFTKEDKEAYSLVQEAYDKAADFTLVFEQACKGKKQLEGTELTPGKPVKVMLFLKAKNIREGFETVGKPALIDYKYDGFRCITGYTKLYIQRRGILSVRHVKVGDRVLTHKGKFREIIAINRRKIDKNERLFEVQSFYGDKFKVSEKHPILVYRKKPQWIKIESVTKKDKLMFPIPKINAKFLYKKELILKDESGYSKKIKLNNFFFRFLGYWIGDGFTNDYHNTERVGLIFNLKKDKKLCGYYKSNIEKYFKIHKISENIHNGAIYLYWRDKPLRIWLSEHFRREWKGKMLPDWFFGINKNQFQNFMRGWIESDGHTDKLNRTSISTKERDLAMFASLLGFKFQKMIGIKKVYINKKDYYRIVLPKSKRGYSVLNKNYFLVDILRINEIKNPYPRTSLYNLHVEKDKSYCTTMITLHNCMINKDEKGEIKIFTRRLDNVTPQFPEVVEYVKKFVSGKSFILDAESVGYDKKGRYRPFQEISQRIKRKYDIEKIARELPVEINVFDILYHNGKNLLKAPFKVRRELIEKIIRNQDYKIRVSKAIITEDEKEAEKFYQKALNEGEEGIMMKNLDAPYKP